ncbi:hypothetical protein F4780DRAFT_776698 [Xylariomycetidae sp. FL0641]|nr:hypothetical protein F4780DRAFT_776698 [Xylariomycetidae sp. FL0641]
MSANVNANANANANAGGPNAANAAGAAGAAAANVVGNMPMTTPIAQLPASGMCGPCGQHYAKLRDHVRMVHLGHCCMWWPQAPNQATRCGQFFQTEDQLVGHFTHAHELVSQQQNGHYSCNWGQGCNYSKAIKGTVVRHVRFHQRKAWEDFFQTL